MHGCDAEIYSGGGGGGRGHLFARSRVPTLALFSSRSRNASRPAAASASSWLPEQLRLVSGCATDPLWGPAGRGGCGGGGLGVGGRGEEEEGGGVQIAEQLSAPCDLMQPCRGCFIRRWWWRRLVSVPPLPNELSLSALQMVPDWPQRRAEAVAAFGRACTVKTDAV